jgi:hypothetical protein
MKLEFLDRFSKFAQISNVMKICLLGAELFHGDGRTEMMKAIVAFCSFANRPNKEQFCICWSCNSCTTVKITDVIALHCLLQNPDNMSKIFLYIKRVYIQLAVFGVVYRGIFIAVTIYVYLSSFKFGPFPLT